MTDQAPEGFHQSVEDDEPAEIGSPVTTGVASVDQVLGELEALDDLPLEEHIGAFERAQESLRSALDAPPDSAPDDPA